jgi:hypothetical protein
MATPTSSIFDLMSDLSTSITIDTTTRNEYGDVRDLYGKLFDIKTPSADGKSVETQRYEYLLCWIFKAFEPVELTAMSFGSRAVLAQSYKDVLQATSVSTLRESLAIIQKLAQTDVSGQSFEMRLLKSATSSNAPLQGVRITTSRLIIQAFTYVTQYAQGKQVVVSQDDSGEPIPVSCFLPEEGDYAESTDGSQSKYYDRKNPSLVNRVYISLSFGNKIRLDGDTNEELRDQLVKDALVNVQVTANPNRQSGYSYSTVAPVIDVNVHKFLLQKQIDTKYVDIMANQMAITNAQTMFAPRTKQTRVETRREEVVIPPTGDLDVTDRLDGETDAEYNARILDVTVTGE